MSPKHGWWALKSTVRGASHIQRNVENQDTIEVRPREADGSFAIACVADGHGSASSFNSAMGAKIAVELSLELAARLSEFASDPAPRSLAQQLEVEVGQQIVREWRKRVEEDWQGRKNREPCLRELEKEKGPQTRAQVEGNPWLAYGATLVTAVASDMFMAFWQLGDGDILVVSRDGAVTRPLPGEELLGDATYSLCSDQAWRHFRTAFYGTTAPLVFVSTDGLSKSFQDEDAFLKFGTDVYQIIVDEGWDAVVERSQGWLERLTNEGSGDDISLAILCRPDLLPAPRAAATVPGDDPEHPE